MTGSNSRLLRGILGIRGSDPEHRLATYLRFEPEEAVQIRVALLKGVEVPLCPRCGETLRIESGSLPGTPLAALLCRRCHRAAILRWTPAASSSEPALASQDSSHPESEEVPQRVSQGPDQHGGQHEVFAREASCQREG